MGDVKKQREAVNSLKQNIISTSQTTLVSNHLDTFICGKQDLTYKETDQCFTNMNVALFEALLTPEEHE